MDTQIAIVLDPITNQVLKNLADLLENIVPETVSFVLAVQYEYHSQIISHEDKESLKKNLSYNVLSISIWKDTLSEADTSADLLTLFIYGISRFLGLYGVFSDQIQKTLEEILNDPTTQSLITSYETSPLEASDIQKIETMSKAQEEILGYSIPRHSLIVTVGCILFAMRLSDLIKNDPSFTSKEKVVEKLVQDYCIVQMSKNVAEVILKD